jgi:hypothetical protein
MALWTDEYDQMLSDCAARRQALSAWEREFVESLQQRIARGRDLTPKQCETLDKLWERVTSQVVGVTHRHG